MERLRSRVSSSPTRLRARAHSSGDLHEAPKASALGRPKVLSVAVLTVVAVLGCIVGHHFWYQNQLLRQAGPVGYHLLNGRR
jgi:G:T-mismatch repair DNA endonuclease (very short patch repair protein)